MLYPLKSWYRKKAREMYRRIHHPRHHRKRPFLRPISQWVAHRSLWIPNVHACKRGAFIGFFLGCQLLPGQMLYSVLIAAKFRGNIPLSIVGCWISNPFTLPAFFIGEELTGRFLWNQIDIFRSKSVPMLNLDASEGISGLYRQISDPQVLFEYLRNIITGGLIWGLILGYLSWLLVDRFWPKAPQIQPISQIIDPEKCRSRE